MKRVSVTDLKNGLSQYLRLVKRGEVVEIMEHQVPIARLTRIEVTTTDDAHRERLIRDGIITPGTRDPRSVKLRPPVPCAVDVVKILIEERGGL
jgi:prevent-host-death family protein